MTGLTPGGGKLGRCHRPTKCSVLLFSLQTNSWIIFADCQLQETAHLPGPRVGTGIVHGDLELHVTEIDPAVALDHVKLFCLWPRAVEPSLVVEAARSR